MEVRVFLSPHLDDAVLSCGGLIARQVATNDVVTVLTVSAGEPGRLPLSALAQSRHARWAQLAAWLAEGCPPDAEVYCPLGLGGHVDHRLTRAAAEQTGRPLWYYRDFPYAARGGQLPNGWTLPGQETIVSLSPEEVQTWGDAITEYRSQLSTFWADPYAQFEELRAFHDGNGGVSPP